jgi:chromate transporter
MDGVMTAALQVRRVSRTALFLGFLKIGMLGFGGIAPWARRVIVEERAWLDDGEYAALLGVGQVLPGPNTMNAAVMIGDRFQGASGALLSLAGLMAMPLAILVTLASLYARFAALPAVSAAVAAVAASAAGLVIGTAIKMMLNIRASWTAWPFAAVVFAATALLRLPLVPVIAIMAPLSIIAAARERRP